MEEAMFFPWIGNGRIMHFEDVCPPEDSQNMFFLVFSPEAIGPFRVGNIRFTPKKNDIFLFPCDSYRLLHLSQEQRTSVVIVSFVVTDSALQQRVLSLGPRLIVDSFLARSCLLNILNYGTLKTDCFSDCLSYNILSLLYHAYVGKQKHVFAPGASGGDIIFAPSPNAALNRILSYIDEHISEDISIEELGGATLQSPKQIGELFRDEFNCTVLQFINRFRIFKAKELLCFTNYSVTEISSMTGFGSIHYFSRYFKEKEKITPIEYKRTIKHMR